jgi:PRTRC genetic system protein E
MTTDFFSKLATLYVEGDYRMTIKAGLHNRMIVSLYFTNDKATDKACKVIPPLTLKGTIEELDNHFFATITQPVQQTAAFFNNVDQHAKALEAARLNSKLEKDKQDAGKKEKETAQKKYETLMKKVAELEAAGKFREAYAQLPKPTDFPEQEATINEKKQALLEKFEQPGLF